MKRIISTVLLITTFIALSGCGSLFKKEYLSVSKYTDESRSSFSSDVSRIVDYKALKQAVITMVNNHQTEGRLKFTNYDGSLQGDISQACQEVKSENTIASFAVDYMSYDLSRIANYYEAVVYITYKHTQGEIDAIRYITGKSQLISTLDPVLENMGSYTAFKITSASITGEEVKNAVYLAYSTNPASCVVMPNVTVQIHPQSGLHRIVEINLEYGWKMSDLQKMKSSLIDKINGISSSVSADKDAVFALEAYEALAQKCTYDPTGFLRNGKTELNSGLGSTAYGALVEGNADSTGIAAAYSALCNKVGIECFIVNGNFENENHSWNIINLEGTYYHVDVSADSTVGIGNAFMRSDSQMQEKYTWDKTAYPSCNGVKSYYDIITRTY